MARSIPPKMAKILERLELERPELVTSADLAEMLEAEGIATPVAVFASRMKDKGWLLPTGLRGVWEFAPAEVAGPYSSMDPLLPLKAFAASHPLLDPMLTMHAATWALGLADRAPSVIDVALPERPGKLSLPDDLAIHAFSPSLPACAVRGVSALAPESVLVHMCSRPGKVRSWQSAAEWLPELTYEMDADRTVTELEGRPASTASRVGYLLQGMRPDIAAAIMVHSKPTAKIRFGPRTGALRNDERWKVSDTLLPFDPREMEDVR